MMPAVEWTKFLSIQAQDFIEDNRSMRFRIFERHS